MDEQDKYFRDILGDQGKRVVLALCSVIIAIVLLPGIDFSDLSLFGVKPAPNDEHAKIIVFVVLWAILIYHSVYLAAHAYDDVKDWVFALLPGDSVTREFPTLRMYFGFKPNDKITRARINEEFRDATWEKFNRKSGKWTVRYIAVRDGDDVKEASKTPFNLEPQKVRSVRNRMFKYIADVGFPSVLFIVALGATIYTFTSEPHAVYQGFP